MKNGDTPAFPGEGSPYFESNDGEKRLRADYGFPQEPNPGLTKRELFAAMAMQGLCQSPHAWNVPTREIAQYATEQADALLAELAKGGAS